MRRNKPRHRSSRMPKVCGERLVIVSNECVHQQQSTTLEARISSSPFVQRDTENKWRRRENDASRQSTTRVYRRRRANTRASRKKRKNRKSIRVNRKVTSTGPGNAIATTHLDDHYLCFVPVETFGYPASLQGRAVLIPPCNLIALPVQCDRSVIFHRRHACKLTS